jgi:phosphate transport system substrate-binding protein
MRISAHRRVAAATAVLALTAAACGGGDIEDSGSAEEAESGADTEPAAAEDGEGGGDAEGGGEGAGPGGSIFGAGASFPNPLYQEWIGEYTTEVNPDASIQYESIGSGGGREQFIGQQTTFAGSDSFASDEEIADAVEQRGCGDVLHIPMVFGGVVVAYNIEGVDDLTLDAATIADIFSGEITNIDDPAIAELNEGVDLPDQELTPTVRADGSGTTSIFTTYLEDEDEDWAAEYGSGDEVPWFDGVVQGEQNDGVAAAVAQQPGGIGYLSLEFATQQGLPSAAVVNGDGNAVAADPDTVGASVDGLDLPEDLRFDVLGVGGEGYPIAGTTWVLAYTCGYDDDEAELLKDYLTWALQEGDEVAAELGYAPLSDDTEALSLENVEQINSEG